MPKKLDNPSKAVLRVRRHYERQKQGVELPRCVSCGALIYNPENAANPRRIELGLCSTCWSQTDEGREEKSLRDHLRNKQRSTAKPKKPKPFSDKEKIKYAKNQARVDKYFALWMEGYSLEEIGESDGVSKQAIALWINLHPDYRFREV